MTHESPGGYHVEVRGLEHLRGFERKIVFHGVNKSGSMVMTKVLFDAYKRARRGNQFFSTYLKVPRDHEHLLALIEGSSGHSFFGAHYLYGAFNKRQGEHLLTTQFRHPLPRVLSCYQWIKNKRDAEGQTYPSFEDWVPLTRGVTHSQVEQFALGYSAEGRSRLAKSRGGELLEQAIANIEREVDWFGIAEYFEESAFCMAAICGLPTLPPWERDERNRNRELVDNWPQERIDLVRDVYRWDFLLYDWALERFRNNIKQLEFGADLRLYQAACADQYKDRLDTNGQPIHGEVATRNSERVSLESVARLRAQEAAAQATVERLQEDLVVLRQACSTAVDSEKRSRAELINLQKSSANRPTIGARSKRPRLISARYRKAVQWLRGLPVFRP